MNTQTKNTTSFRIALFVFSLCFAMMSFTTLATASQTNVEKTNSSSSVSSSVSNTGKESSVSKESTVVINEDKTSSTASSSTTEKQEAVEVESNNVEVRDTNKNISTNSSDPVKSGSKVNAEENTVVAQASDKENEATVQASAKASTQEIYRLYNPGLKEHLYTTDANEVKVLTSRNGWQDEGTGWTAPSSGTPVYRLYNAGLKTHLYTTDTNEVNTLCKSWGWVKDFSGKPLFYSGGGVEITRLYNPGLAQHHYTADSNEIKTITQPQWGWKNEGTKLYCIETPAEKKYDIVYKNYDGSVLGQKSNVAYNQRAATANLPSNSVKIWWWEQSSNTYKYKTVTYTTPQRQDGSYVFNGWKESVSGNTLTMTAQYKKFTYTNGMPAETAKDLEDYFNRFEVTTSQKTNNPTTYIETINGCDKYSLWFKYGPRTDDDCHWSVKRVIEGNNCTYYFTRQN